MATGSCLAAQIPIVRHLCHQYYPRRKAVFGPVIDAQTASKPRQGAIFPA